MNTFHTEGTVDTIAWSVGGERRTASLRVVRRENADMPQPTDLLTFAQAPALPEPSAVQPTRITDRRARRQSSRTRTRPVHKAA